MCLSAFLDYFGVSLGSVIFTRERVEVLLLVQWDFNSGRLK